MYTVPIREKRIVGKKECQEEEEEEDLFEDQENGRTYLFFKCLFLKNFVFLLLLVQFTVCCRGALKIIGSVCDEFKLLLSRESC